MTCAMRGKMIGKLRGVLLHHNIEGPMRAGDKSGRCRIRTSDPYLVEVVL